MLVRFVICNKTSQMTSADFNSWSKAKRSESVVSIRTVFFGEYEGDDEKSLGIVIGGKTSCIIGMNSAFVKDTTKLDLPTPSSPHITTRIVSLVIVRFGLPLSNRPLILYLSLFVHCSNFIFGLKSQKSL